MDELGDGNEHEPQRALPVRRSPNGLTGPMEPVCQCTTTLRKPTRQSLDAKSYKCGLVSAQEGVGWLLRWGMMGRSM